MGGLSHILVFRVYGMLFMVKSIYVQLRGDLGVHKQFIGYFLKLFSLCYILGIFQVPGALLLSSKLKSLVFNLLHCGVNFPQLHLEPSEGRQKKNQCDQARVSSVSEDGPSSLELQAPAGHVATTVVAITATGLLWNWNMGMKNRGGKKGEISLTF